jgi:hypothetical protein
LDQGSRLSRRDQRFDLKTPHRLRKCFTALHSLYLCFRIRFIFPLFIFFVASAQTGRIENNAWGQTYVNVDKDTNAISTLEVVSARTWRNEVSRLPY